MKPGERFTFRVIPSSICGNRRRKRDVGDSSELSIPIGDDAWWNKKFMTKASLGEGVNYSIRQYSSGTLNFFII